MREIAYWQAINEALQEEMDRDPNVFLLGEDIGIYGGAYGATRGLLDKYGPERVIDTAISESAITGAATGAAMLGKRPVAEIMYVDFMGQAMDQLCNQAAKIRYMFGGKFKVPMVLRTEGGAGRTLGSHHSQSLEHWFTGIPGLKVVMPSTPYDAKGLLKSSIRDDNPIVFIEHKMLYKEKGPVPEGDYTEPLGVADIKRQGKDVTVVSYSKTVLDALQAAKELEAQGIDAEVIDVRTLIPLDINTIINSVKKTNHVVVVHEACKTGGFGAEIGMQIAENAFDYLDAPIKRLGAIDVPIPKSPVLEQYVIPKKEDIIQAVKELLE